MITSYKLHEIHELMLSDLQGLIQADVDRTIEKHGGKTRNKKRIYTFELDMINKLKEKHNNANS